MPQCLMNETVVGEAEDVTAPLQSACPYPSEDVQGGGLRSCLLLYRTSSEVDEHRGVGPIQFPAGLLV